MVNNLNKGRPPGWGEAELFSFIEDSWSNALATFANKNIICRRLDEVDQIFLKVQRGLSLSRMTDLVPALLFMRCFSAYRSMVTLGLASPTDAFAVMRSCLESAAYAMYVHGDEKLAEVWLRRSETKSAAQEVRGLFKQGLVRAAIKAKDPKVASDYGQLYERAIDFGAHPNEQAVLTNMVAGSLRGGGELQYSLLSGDGPLLDGILRSAVQTGICALHIFSHVFPARYDGSVRAELARVSRDF